MIGYTEMWPCQDIGAIPSHIYIVDPQILQQPVIHIKALLCQSSCEAATLVLQPVYHCLLGLSEHKILVGYGNVG